MSDPFQSIRDSCKAIENNKLNDSGIFTNAILSRPEVTTLIRDALVSEQGLYKISRNSGLSSSLVRDSSDTSASLSHVELNPERIDGKTFYSAPAAPHNTNAVPIPLLVQESVKGDRIEDPGSPSKRGVTLNHTLVPDEVLQSDDVNVVSQALISILEQYPSLQTNIDSKNDIVALREEFQSIDEEISVLEREVAEQSLKLDRYNENLNELSPRKSNFSPKKHLSADEVIRKEELEVAELEHELEKRSMS